MLIGLLLAQILLPVKGVYAHQFQMKPGQDNTTLLNGKIYLTTSTLQPMFQSQLDQQVPKSFSTVINNLVGKLPQSDRDWAAQMATTLIQPSATVTQFKPQQDGLLTSVRLKLYPNDPKPIDTSMLVKFNKQDATTIQVSADEVKGSPSLMKGPLTTFHLPIGQLNSLNTTPGCGDSALALNLQMPLTLGSQRLASPQQNPTSQNLVAYVEIPATALSLLGGSIGTMQISKHLSATNIHVGVSGSELAVNSDIMFDSSLRIGTATTLMEPQANNGNLNVHVTKTSITVLNMTFPYDTYNQQVEDSLNAQLGKALAGKFYVTNALIGADDHVSCVADDSLLLIGTTKIG